MPEITPPKTPDFDAYRLLVQEMKDYAIFILDVDGRILTWNAGAERLKGWKADEIIGQHFSIFYTKEDRDSGKPARQLAIAMQEGRVEDDGWRLRTDGSRFWANVVFSALRNPDGTLRGFAKVTRDMTERHNNEERLARTAAELRESRDLLELRVAERIAELSHLNKDLEQANRMKDEFLATLSHELRTPLTAIVGWVQMLRAGGLNEAQTKRALEVIDRNLTAQTQLIEDLLNISRIISGKLKIDPQVLFPAPIIEETLESVKPSIEAKQLNLELDIDQELGPLRIDPARFQQIVWNLLSNAVKFTPRSGAVRVTLKHVENHAVFSISDTGEGIDSDFLPYVFDRFRQADSSRSRKHGGLGLGLAIVRHLVELHGGSVAVDSQGSGRGSTFSVSLPIPPLTRKTVNTEPAAAEIAGTQLTGVRVLVLEDDMDTREMVVQALENSGAVVHEASSTREALRHLETVKTDIVVSDIGMQGGDGYEFLRALRERDSALKGIRAVALTAYATEEDRAASIAAGFDAHIAKPVALSELIRTVAALHNRV